MDRHLPLPKVGPSGRGFAPPSALPLHVSNQGSFHNSTGSHESIGTQVPEAFFADRRGMSPALDGGFNLTPEIPFHGQFQSFNGGHGTQVQHRSSGPLNPNSASYVPASPAFDIASQYNSSPYDSRNSSFSGIPLPPVAMGSQHRVEPDYFPQHQNGYAPSMMSSALPSPALGAPQNAYGQFMAAPSEYVQAQYNMNQQIAPQNQHNFAPPPGLGQNGMSFGQHAAQFGVEGYGVPAQSQYSAQQPHHQAGMNGQYQSGYIAGYGYVNPPAVEHPYLTSANANRGKPAAVPQPQFHQPQFRQMNNRSNNSNRSNNNSSTGNHKMHKGKKNGGNNGYNGSQSGYNSSQQGRRGGPVLPPNGKAPSIGSSLTKLSEDDSTGSFDFQSHDSQPLSNTVSQTASEDEAKLVFDSDMGSPTPGRRIHKETSVVTELRGTQTPTLRSRRGQTIQVPATDPTHVNTAVWLNKLDHRPPPKMESLTESIASTFEFNKYAPVTGSDIFNSAMTTSPRSAVRGAPPLIDKFPGTYERTPKTPKRDKPVFMSKELMYLLKMGSGLPSIDEALDLNNLPFVEYCRRPSTQNVDAFGVVKIKNIPYGVNRAEILAFLGRNARILCETEYEPVHIVMERVTSKTLDCYIEFINLNEAVAAVNRFDTNRSNGRSSRLGDRHVDMEVSSQEALMAELFPKAKNVRWIGNDPVVSPTDPHDKYNSGFAGFISREEIIMLVKHVEAPQRSPFSKDCPQRPFECMISTLFKYPWHMVDYITIEDRELLFGATKTLLIKLRDRIDNPPRGNQREEQVARNLNNMLHKRLWRAALLCVGFTPTMKDSIALLCNVHEDLAQELGVPLFAADWKYLWTIGPKPGVPHDLTLWYAAIMRETTAERDQHLSLAEKAVKGVQNSVPKLFGELEKYIDLPKDFAEFQSMTLAQVAQREWAGIEMVLRQALTARLEFPNHA